MLLKASLTPDIVKSEDALCRELYKFLNDFVPRRLKFESCEEREDCVQETILYILNRFKNHDKPLKTQTDIEKFFYNKANTFISGYISKIKVRRNAARRHIKHTIEEFSRSKPPPINTDIDLLYSIIDSYHFGDKINSVLMYRVQEIMEILGYDVQPCMLDDELSQLLLLFDSLSYAIVDQYISRALKEKEEDSYN